MTCEDGERWDEFCGMWGDIFGRWDNEYGCPEADIFSEEEYAEAPAHVVLHAELFGRAVVVRVDGSVRVVISIPPAEAP